MFISLCAAFGPVYTPAFPRNGVNPNKHIFARRQSHLPGFWLSRIIKRGPLCLSLPAPPPPSKYFTLGIDLPLVISNRLERAIHYHVGFRNATSPISRGMRKKSWCFIYFYSSSNSNIIIIIIINMDRGCI